MTDNSFNSLENANRQDVLERKEINRPASSVFPYGRSSILSMNEGYLYPVDTFFTLPGDQIDIDFACFLESLNAFVERQYSGMRLAFHAYYNKCEHEWKGWKDYATRGRRGNISLSLPASSLEADVVINGKRIRNSAGTLPLKAYFDTVNSLCSFEKNLRTYHVSNQTRITGLSSTDNALLDSHYMGDNTQVNRTCRLAIDSSNKESTVQIGGSIDARTNAIPDAMYQRVFRDFYLNKNLVKDNKNWFPDDDDDFCIPYSTSGAVARIGVAKTNKSLSTAYYSLVPNNCKKDAPTSSDLTDIADDPCLGAMRVRQWQGDPFTTCVPFIERNGETTLFSQANTIAVQSQVTNPLGIFNGLISQKADLKLTKVGTDPNSASINSPFLASTAYNYMDTVGSIKSFQSGSVIGEFSLVNFITMNQFQELAAATLWSRRNAKSDGDYNSLIQAHYGWNPKSQDRSPTYLGGSIQRIEFQDVVSTAETTNQPLGSVTSRALSGGRNKIPHFVAPDFGYVMILASLVPDTFYTQGLSEEFDASLKGAELPWPEFANLQKENVLGKRLFLTGTTFDTRLIGYNERFLRFKYRQNQLLGHLADSYDTKFRSMSFARFFDYTDIQSLQSIDNEFVSLSPYNVRDDMYSVPKQPHFILQFGDNVRIVRSLPYAAKESTLTNVA